MQISQMAASVGAATGLVAMGFGSAGSRTGMAISGSALLIVSAMVICAHVVLRALRDTTAERAALAEERDLAIAAQAGVASERERMRLDLARGRKAAQDMLDRERKALHQAFEEEKFAIQKRAILVALKMEQSGMLDKPPATQTGSVVHLPVRQPADVVAMAASDD